MKLNIIPITLYLLFTSIAIAYTQTLQYGFAIGDKVNLRSEPTVNSSTIRQLYKGEFLQYLGKTNNKMRLGNDEEYWYNVKALDNKSGWIYGKYFFDLFDNKEINILYKQIFDKVIFKERVIDIKEDNSNLRLYKLNFKKLNNTFYNFSYSIDYDIHDIIGSSAGKCYLYEYVNNKLYFRAYEGCHNTQIDEDYIFSYSDYKIAAYKREVDVTKNYDSNCKEDDTCYMYKRTHSLISSVFNKKPVLYGDKLIFDPITRNVIIQVKLKKDEPYKTIHYKFDNGKFVKVSEE